MLPGSTVGRAADAAVSSPQVGVTVPGDNSIDVLTNDVAVVVISNSAGEVEVRDNGKQAELTN